MKKNPLLFMHAPPEHIPHVINASVLYNGLKKVHNLNPKWVTMNNSKKDKLLYTEEFMKKMKLEELLEGGDVEIENCCQYVNDEMNPREDELEDFILNHKPSVVFVYYFPPFWYPLVKICKKHKIPIGIHVQVNYVVNNDNFIFDNVENARRALKEADFLTVSQEKEKIDLANLLNKNNESIYVINKSIPSKVLLEVINGENDENFNTEYTDIYNILNNGKKNIGYIGRLDDIKNIHWFLKECMEKLNNYHEKFNCIIIGRGNKEEEISLLSKKYKNVYLLNYKLPYKDTLTFLRMLDLALFPSGYDLTPRLPLEALTVGTDVILGDFNFNDKYKKNSIVIPEGEMDICYLDYTGYKAFYGVPEVDSMVSKIKEYIHSDNTNNINLDTRIEAVNPLNNIKAFYNAIEKYIE